MRACQFAKYLYKADQLFCSRFVSMQNHYNLIYREEEREMMPLCREEGIGCIPWSPLARGFLAGNRTRLGGGDTIRAKTDNFANDYYYRDDDFAVVDRTAEVAKQLDCKPAQVALAWVLSNPIVTAPIIGASKLGHLEEALEALHITLSIENKATLEECYRPHPILGHD